MIVPQTETKREKVTISTSEIKGDYEIIHFVGHVNSCGGFGTTEGFLVNRLSQSPMTIAFACEDNANFQNKPGISLWVPKSIKKFSAIALELNIDLKKWGNERPFPFEDGLYKLANDSTEKLVKA